MKIKDTYILRNVAGQNIIIPIGGDNVNFNRAITINETGAFIWNLLSVDTTAEKITEELTREFSVDYETAFCDVKSFLDLLSQNNMLEI